MPALAADDSWRRKYDSAFVPGRFPWWLEPTAKQTQAGEVVMIAAKVILYGGFLLVHPLSSAENSLRWLRTKFVAPFQPSSPVYALPAWMEPGVFESLVNERLGELFFWM